MSISSVRPMRVTCCGPALMAQPVARCLADCVERQGSLRLSQVHITAAVGDPVDLAEIHGATWFQEAGEWVGVNVTPELVHTEETTCSPSAQTEVELASKHSRRCRMSRCNRWDES